ncbi:hypothetical protein [Catenuloplanes indicus]|uniref:Uncharacterized protein n=1 Tax=Catenuloplanes indicus TaxID=137267 RepID=A0AAE3VVZ1_9ACTN|nr:hypothetical protein [Catenuloplanes indicus]MDQ0364237.1 hypothetical protein [Catenuloplanes indicus]
MTAPGLLDRYHAGDRERVWHELRQLGRSVRDDPALAAEAQEVCDEMARRARHNVELLVARLTAAGYRFHHNDDEQTPATPYAPPTPDATAYANWLESTFGEIPMTLRSWIRYVGDVWLVGTHPEWPDSSSGDPLVIELEGSLNPRYGSMRETHERCRAHHRPEWGPFVLAVAPDALHKANTSGGDPYGFLLPDGCADGSFRVDAAMPFVSYLNVVFTYGGFPEITGDDAEWSIRHELSMDLLPL